MRSCKLGKIAFVSSRPLRCRNVLGLENHLERVVLGVGRRIKRVEKVKVGRLGSHLLFQLKFMISTILISLLRLFFFKSVDTPLLHLQLFVIGRLLLRETLQRGGCYRQLRRSRHSCASKAVLPTVSFLFLAYQYSVPEQNEDK
jgi:hypothetical protein